MRVLQVITTLDRGGAENQLLLLVREQVKLGIDVTVVPLKGSNELEKEFSIYGAKVMSKIPGTNILSQIIILRKLATRFDIVHAHLPRAELLGAIVAKQKLIVTKHNCESFWPSAPKIVSNLLSRFVQKRAFIIVAISSAVKKFLIKNHEAPINKIKLIHYGFDPLISYAALDTVRSFKGYPIVGTVSRLVKQKDIKTIINGMKQIKETFPAFKFILIGDGPLKRELESHVNTQGLTQNVEWLGRVSSPLEYMRKFDVFVIASLYEGFGLVVLEAMSQGVPVVASDNEAFREIFNGTNKQLFPIGNADLLSLRVIAALNPLEKSIILKNQSTIIETYSYTKMINQVQFVYSEFLGQK